MEARRPGSYNAGMSEKLTGFPAVTANLINFIYPVKYRQISVADLTGAINQKYLINLFN